LLHTQRAIDGKANEGIGIRIQLPAVAALQELEITRHQA
jgi:hypothetical protein